MGGTVFGGINVNSHKKNLSLLLQTGLCYLFFPMLFLGICCWMRLNKYRIKNLSKVRQDYLCLIKQKQVPKVICCNHLTYVDSLLVAYALGGLKTFLFNFKALPWNLPKKSNVTACWYYPLLCYLGKCMQLPRDVAGAKKVLAKSKGLVQKGESVLLFPEGTRSESGRVEPENVLYGVGELIECEPSKAALLIYLRGDRQEKKSKYPRKDQCFFIKLLVKSFETTESGRRAHRQIAQDVIKNLKQLEDEYFEDW